MASLRNLPTELHYHILFFLVDVVDQIAATGVCTLWRSILQTRTFLESRYQTEPKCALESPQIHKLLLLSSDRQISCITRNGTIESHGIRFLNNDKNHGRDPNSFDAWDISGCPFLDEPPFRRTESGALTEPCDFHVETSTWLPAGYLHCSKLPESATIRYFVNEFMVDIRNQLDSGGLLPNIFQEITIYQFVTFPKHDRSERIGSLNGCVVRRSENQYLQWIEGFARGVSYRQSSEIGDV